MKEKLLLFCLFLLLVGCSSQPNYAPVVNGWNTPAGHASYYRVRDGDTLYSIAWAFNVDYRDIARANHLKNYEIHPGEKLKMVSPANEKLPAKIPAKSTSLSHHPSHKPVEKGMTPTSSYSVKEWIWPAKGKIIAGYSNQLGKNRGINIGGGYGEPVRAAASGTVVYSGSQLQGYGKLIIIKHNDSYLSAYAFNKVILVKEGQHVRAGQQIAQMGKNNEGQILLHFEIRKDGKPVNPLHYLG